METFKESLIVASTGHMPVELVRKMNAVPLFMNFRDPAGWVFESIPGFYVDPTAYGWLCTTSEDFDATWPHGVLFPSVEMRDECTRQLRVLWEFAKCHGCRRILFDADAAVVPDLPMYTSV